MRAFVFRTYNFEFFLDMRLIKLALISLVVLFLVVFLISLLIPAHVRISRAINVDCARPANYVSETSTWMKWNELLKNTNDSLGLTAGNKKITGKRIEIVLTEATQDTVRTVWRNQNGKEIAGVFTFHTAGNITVIQWYFDFYQRWYPWEKFASINFDKQWGPAMEKSLENLKKLCEGAQ